MPAIIPNYKKSSPFRLPKRVDDFLTNYLRNTTTDQEILDFYGEGNIIGRKGIPANDEELLDAVEASRELSSSPLRPSINRPNYAVGGIDQTIGYDYKTTNMPSVIDPATGRPWQMTFGVLPKDFGSGQLTPSAKQFLLDFRIPTNAGNDYSFATGPNIQDRINYETNFEIENDPYYGKNPEKLQEKLDKIRNQDNFIGDYSGSPQTPRTWQERGYITDKPTNLKPEVIKEFKNKIFETQGPFGGVSTLTPVPENKAINPNWRADLYQTEGLAGPLSKQTYNTGYGVESKNVQRFTTGSERLLPLQPYSEFYQFDPTPISVVATKPAEDFTPFQKTIGTRNYLIGRNILEGRGGLGTGFRAATAATAVPLAGKLAGFLGPVGDAFDFSEGMSSALNPKNTTGERVAGGVQATGAGYGLAALGTTLAGGAALPAALPIAVGTGVTAGSIRAAEAMKNPAIRMADVPSFRKALPAVSTKGFNRNDPIPPGKAVAILNGKPILVDKGSIAGNKKVGRPWWDAGQYFGQ